MYITMKLILNMIFCLIIKICTYLMINKSIKNVNKRTYSLHDIIDTLPEHSQVVAVAVVLHPRQVAAVIPLRRLSLAASRHGCHHRANW